MYRIVLALLIVLPVRAELSWDVTSPSRIVAKAGDRVFLYGMARVADNPYPHFWSFGSRARITFGGAEYRLYLGSDDTTWSAPLSGATLGLLVNIATGETAPYLCELELGTEKLELYEPQVGTIANPAYPTFTRAYTFEPQTLPTALNQPYALLVTDSAGRSVAGQAVVERISANGVDAAMGTASWRWTRNGAPLSFVSHAHASENPAGLYAIGSFDPARDAGVYVVTFTNPATGESLSWTTTVVDAATLQPSQLVNVSVRIGAGTGDQTLIAGFVVAGAGTKSLLVRGVGPTLSPLGVSGALANPQLELYDLGRHVSLARNDDWADSAAIRDAGERLGAHPLLVGSHDSALLQSLRSGVYTALVTGANSSSGIAMAEVYDADYSAAIRIVNISARAQVGTGDGILIAGFVVAGEAPKTVLIRAVGPDLAAAGVTSPLANPQLELYRLAGGQTTLVNSNDDWGSLSAIAATAVRVGAQPLTSDKDAVILATLQPGVYTAQVKGVRDGTGVALVEVYDAD